MSRPASKLDKLSKEERTTLIHRLSKKQANTCFICGDPINLQTDEVDVDHIIGLTHPDSLDDEQNWGLTHKSHNRSKGDRDLQLMQYIYNFRKHKDRYVIGNKDFTVGDALQEFYPNRKDVFIKIDELTIKITYPQGDGTSKTESYPIIIDPNDKSKSFFAMIPYKSLFHDPKINPRSIVHLEPLIQEFYENYPQLQPSLATLNISGLEGSCKIMLFDGQHKATAQLYNRKERLLCRIFINPNINKLKQTNFRAHTILAQIQFPDVVKDKVGHDLFGGAYESWLDKADINTDSEEKFIKQEEVGDDYKSHLQSYLKYETLFGEEKRHNILDYVETISSRSKKFPLVYDTLDKTFFHFFLYERPSSEPLQMSQKYRKFERENLSKLMQLFVDEILSGRFNFEKGIYKIEDRLTSDSNEYTNEHLTAYRICRASAMVIWVEQLNKSIIRLLKTRQRYFKNDWSEKRVFWAELKNEDWKIIRNMLKVIKTHNIWIEKNNQQIIQAISSTKQKDWREMLLDGRLPGRTESLFQSLNDTKIFDKALEMSARND